MHLDIVGSGMVTPVGYQAPETCAAIRAGFDNFQQTRFEFDGDFLRAGVVALDTPSMLEKHAQMAISAIDQCMLAAHPSAPEDTASAMCLAETERPGRVQGLNEQFVHSVCSRIEQPGRLGARALFQTGTMGGVEALLWAEAVLEQRPQLNHCIIVGVDSYLTRATLTALHSAGRLLTAKNSDGFLPGEAAAAVLVSPGSGAPVAIECRGVGWGREKATVGSGIPLRGDGLAQAFRAAFKAAGFGFPEVHYRLADVSGEQYAFKEAALALLRTMRVRKENLYIWHPADCVGRTGAASVPLILGVALAAARRCYSPGPGALCHFADDAGVRAAIVIRERDRRNSPDVSPIPR